MLKKFIIVLALAPVTAFAQDPLYRHNLEIQRQNQATQRAIDQQNFEMQRQYEFQQQYGLQQQQYELQRKQYELQRQQYNKLHPPRCPDIIEAMAPDFQWPEGCVR